MKKCLPVPVPESLLGAMDRFASLLGIFTRGRRADSILTIGSLMERSGKSRDFLSVWYRSARAPQHVRDVAIAAAQLMVEAQLLVLKDPEAVYRYVLGEDAPEIEDAIARALADLRCIGCGGFFEAKAFLKPFSRCYPCYNAHQASPATKAWLTEVDQAIAKAPKALRVAWQAARREPKAVSYKRLAELTKQPEADLRAAWEAAGLPLRPAGRPRKDGSTRIHEKLHSGEMWAGVVALAPRQRKPVWLRAGRSSSSRRTARAGVGQTSFPFAPAAPAPGSAEAA